MSRSASASERSRRAPRLDARTYLAPYITRGGRFRKLDPLRGRSLPSIAKTLGVLGWAALLGESLRRAWKANRPAPESAVTEPAATGSDAG